jgi:Domain of unknown function (DUF4397)
MILAATMLVGVSASNAWALELRLVHAVAGAGSARLSTDGSSTGPVGFAGVSSPVTAPDGKLTLRLLSSTGNKPLASATKTLGGGSYTVVATKRGAKVTLLFFRDQGAKKGKASLRAIHAAPELGNADLTADGTAVAKKLAFEGASAYATLEPGTYKLEAMRPSGSGGPLATKAGVNLEAGTSATAVLAGSGGKPTTIIVASDAAVTPAQAPKTGLGGLAGGTPWLAALLAALAAGAVGGGAYMLAARRNGG